MVGDLHPGEWPMRGLPGVAGGLQRGELPQPPDPSKLSGLVGGRRGLRPAGGVACVFGILAPSARGRQGIIWNTLLNQQLMSCSCGDSQR
jgi:hypothetical protein